MILREVISPGESQRWMLITQIEHARLSYELATNWGAGEVRALEPDDELLMAILHHDDGWADWEKEPDVDPETGRPLNFLEMPIDVAVSIWQRSIDVAAEFGPLAAYIVSGHFAALVSRAWESHASNSHWRKLVDGFLRRQDLDRAAWLAVWHSGASSKSSPARSKELANRGLAQLQMFDALSLWFCMAEETEPVVFPTPDGPELTWTPVGASEVTVAPWPWTREVVRGEVVGRLIPIGRYGSQADLAQAHSNTGRLEWTIRPA